MYVHLVTAPMQCCNYIRGSVGIQWLYILLFRPYFKDHGTVDISASDITLDVSIGLTRNKTSGGIHLTTTSCSFTASNFDVHFHGGDG